ncbi:MAG: HAMP domain-containing sensor histidine kinase [Hyphomicrobiales bacterium]
MAAKSRSRSPSSLETDTGNFVIASIRDISVSGCISTKLPSEKNEELERASKAKDHFLANMSHELRTPLTVILGFIKTLMMQTAGPLNAEQERQTAKIETNAAHLLTLLDDLLDLAKVESGSNEISFEPVDLRSVLEDLEASWQPEAASKGLSLTIQCPQRLDLNHSNRRIVTQILQNLLSNSIKFTDRGSVRVAAEREFRNDRTETRIHVIDTGIGIKPEDDDKLFQPFSQLNPDTYKGTGLGLLLCRNLARSIGGDVTYESVPGLGSTFTLALREEPSASALARLAG